VTTAPVLKVPADSFDFEDYVADPVEPFYPKSPESRQNGEGSSILFIGSHNELLSKSVLALLAK
jgi:hypothetical protein